MPVWAIVPVKPFREAKSRLAAALSSDERAALSREFLVHTLQVLRQVSDITTTLVVSRDTSALHLARKQGAYTVTESGAPELNSALARATDVGVSFGADAVLILPCDLPLLTPDNLAVLIGAGARSGCVVIAPDRRGDGTNALFVRPPRAIPFSFGPGSYQRHVQLAQERSIQVEVCLASGFSLDVDLPQDLELYQSLRSSPVVNDA
jgi:2-phospho-L-lactate/phosphoenolpyruvate guanylyltransferase